MAKKKEDPRYYVIESGIPMPPRNYSLASKKSPIPFMEMQIGDSILLPPGEDMTNLKRRIFAFIKKKTLEGVEISYGQRKFADGTVRIWRVK